jgi:hypothetical protein
MRRLLGIFIALAVPLLVVGGVALATYKPGLPDMAQRVLNQYLADQRHGAPPKVVEIRLAAHPHAFTANLSGPTYGQGYYFGVTHDQDLPVTVPSPLTSAVITYSNGITSVMSYDGSISPQRSLPYPPAEVWCVRLQPEAMVLVALHGDLYVDVWVVHELTPNTAAQTLALIGCAP